MEISNALRIFLQEVHEGGNARVVLLRAICFAWPAFGKYSHRLFLQRYKTRHYIQAIPVYFFCNKSYISHAWRNGREWFRDQNWSEIRLRFFCCSAWPNENLGMLDLSRAFQYFLLPFNTGWMARWRNKFNSQWDFTQFAQNKHASLPTINLLGSIHWSALGMMIKKALKRWEKHLQAVKTVVKKGDPHHHSGTDFVVEMVLVCCLCDYVHAPPPHAFSPK